METREHLQVFQGTYRSLANDRRAFDKRRNEDAAFVAEIESLYTYFVGPLTHYCGNCLHDAFMRLMTLKIDKMKNSRFRLLAGTLLFDPVNQDVDYMLTPARLEAAGDDLALRHLAHNPRARQYFQMLPENVDEMIADYLKRERGEAEAAATVEAAEPAAIAETETEAAEAPAPATATKKRRSSATSK